MGVELYLESIFATFLAADAQLEVSSRDVSVPRHNLIPAFLDHIIITECRCWSALDRAGAGPSTSLERLFEVL